MLRSLRVLSMVLVGLGLIPASSSAETIWATWNTPAGNQTTGSFGDGRSVVFTAPLIGSILPAGAQGVDPDLPGLPGGVRPELVVFFTAADHPTTIQPDDVLLTLDLAGFPIDSATTFGLEDIFFDYRIELLDAAQTPLPLSGVSVANFNLDLAGVIADYDLLLDAMTGTLTVNQVHDANTGSTYRHSGLALFSNLPTDTRFIRLASNAMQGTEGIRFSFGAAELPEPAVTGLLACALVAFAARRWHRSR